MTGLLTDQLRTMAAAYPDETAYRNLGDDTSITFDRWERRSNRLARGLADRGVTRGQRVAIVMEPGHVLHWIVTYSAVHKLGAVAVPLNNRLSPPEVRGIMEHAEVTAVVASGSFGGTIGPLVGSVPSLAVVVAVGGPGIDGAVDLEDVMAGDDSPIQAPLDGDDLADIMYTSGTTGRPKGVAVRHDQVARVPNQLPEWQGTGWLTASPVFTFAGLGFIHNPMKSGMTVLHLPAFDAGRWLGDRGTGAAGHRLRGAGHGPAAHPPSRVRLGRPHQPAQARAGQRAVGPPHPADPAGQAPGCRRAQQLRHDRRGTRHLHHGPRGGPDPTRGRRPADPTRRGEDRGRRRDARVPPGTWGRS